MLFMMMGIMFWFYTEIHYINILCIMKLGENSDLIFSLFPESRLTSERQAETAKMMKDFQSELSQLKRDHKKEIDALHRRYVNHAENHKKLEETQVKLAVSKSVCTWLLTGN